MEKEKVTDWELIGDGSEDDPYRPDVFDDEEDDNDYHYDAANQELYVITDDQS